MEGTEEGSSTRTPQLPFAFVDVYAVWEDEMGGSYPPPPPNPRSLSDITFWIIARRRIMAGNYTWGTHGNFPSSKRK